jgi:hypothetical protein
MAHGSLYMLGAYVAVTVASKLGGALGYWGGIVAAAAAVALLGALIELALLRRIYHVAELFQLLATFALVLVIRDVVLAVWGSEELLGPRAHAKVAGQVDPAHDSRTINEELRRTGHIVSTDAGAFVHDAVAPDRIEIRIGEEGEGVTGLAAQRLRLLRRVDADGHRPHARRFERFQVVFDTP